MRPEFQDMSDLNLADLSPSQMQDLIYELQEMNPSDLQNFFDANSEFLYTIKDDPSWEGFFNAVGYDNDTLRPRTSLDSSSEILSNELREEIGNIKNPNRLSNKYGNPNQRPAPTPYDSEDF